MKAILALVGKNLKDFVGGYTIIEVMIVLTVSGIIFVAGITVLSGQSNETAFEQGMQDANSELATRIRGAASSQFFNSQGYDCKTTGIPPRATLSSGSTGNSGSQNQDCVVIGIAIEAPTSISTIYTYQVLGNRLSYTNGLAGGPVSSLAQANPTPASIAGKDLSFAYKLASDINVVSSNAVKSDGTGFTSNLMAFYIDFAGEAAASNNSGQSVRAQAYDYKASSHNSTEVKKCVESTTCSQPTPISAWKLCFQSASGGRRAEIDINNQPTGVTTDLKFADCQ